MKQVFNLVKLFLVILLVSFTSCTNDLSEKNKEISFSFELPQEKINRATNENSDNTLWNINAQIENTKEIIQKIEKTAYSGETVTLTFKEIIVGQEVKINIDLTKKDEKTPTYTGSSDWFIVKNGNNKINLKLNKVEENTPQIIAATIPEIITQPQSIVEIATDGSSVTIEKTLSVSAKSRDNGTLSFIWQEKNSDNTWQKFEPITTTPDTDKIESSIKVTVEKGQSRTFKCIITNTNNSVNGNKTATIETNEATIAYVEGDLTSITATYQSDKHQILGQEFNYSKVTIAETYTKDNTTPPPVTVTANSSRYTISPTKDDEKAIGYVPYTVKYNGNIDISTEIKVPVKYELKAEDFSITSDTNQSETNANNPEKIAQFTGNTVLTVGSKGETSGVPTTIYQDNNSNLSSNYAIMSTGVTSSWKKDSSAYDNTTTSISVDNRNQGTSTYNATITPNPNSWCVGNSITLNYYIQVCPWKIALNTEDENTNLTNLTGNTTYTLSATNEADENPSVTFTSDNNAFAITNNTTLTTPQASTSDQTATITAKVDDVTIGTITVIVKQLGSSTNPFTNWQDLCNYLRETSTDATTIYVQRNLDATETATVNRPVTIIPDGDVTITLDENFNGEQLFNINADLTLKGEASNQFTIDGDGYELEDPLISTDNSNITLKYVTMKNYTNFPENNSNPAGGAISFNCTDKTLSLKNCNFTNVITTIMPNDDFAIGAIYFGNGNLILDSCTFTQDGENVVDLYCYPQNNSTITLKETINLPIIQYNNSYSSSNGGDLQISLDSTFNSSESIQVYVDNIGSQYDTDLFTLNGQELPECFTLLNEGYEFDYENGTITKVNAGGGGSGNEITINSQNYSNYFNESFYVLPTGIYNVTEDITFDYPIKIENGSDVTIKAITNNVTLTQPTNKNLIHVANGGNLTLGGGAKMLTLKGANNASDKIIYINCGTVTLTEGCTIDGVQSSSSSNVYAIVMTGGTFEMAGGTIQNHKIGSIISNDDTARGDCIINIYGGEILKNKSTANGGVINLKNKSTTSTVNIYGTVSIHDNECYSNNNGGSIYTTGSHTININNSTEYENKASIYDNYQGTKKQGASIYKNTNSTVTIMDYTLTSGLYEKNIINGVAQE